MPGGFCEQLLDHFRHEPHPLCRSREGGNPGRTTACAVGMAQVRASENTPRCTLWTRLDSRLRGNDVL